MGKLEYKDSKKILYKTRVRLSLLQKQSEEADCFITESHLIIDTEQPIRIPLHHIKVHQIENPDTIKLMYLDELDRKEWLSVKMAATPFADYFNSNLKSAINEAKDGWLAKIKKRYIWHVTGSIERSMKDEVTKRKKVVSWILIGCFFVLSTFLAVKGVEWVSDVLEDWAEIRQVPSTTSDLIVFHTGGGSLLLPIIGIVSVLLGVLLFVVSSIKFKRKWSKGTGIYMAIFLIGLGSFWLYTQPLREEIIVDKAEEVMTMKVDYLIRDEISTFGFGEILHIKYERNEGKTVVERGIYVRYSARGTVSVVKSDNTEIQLYRNGPESARRVAREIAIVTGKRLVVFE